jgi:N utilization substance protein A
LTGWDIDILTEQEESERRQKEFHDRTQLFVGALDVDEMVGQLLASEGFATVEDIAFIEPEEIYGIEGFDEETAAELQARAREYLARIEAEQDSERIALGVEDGLKEVPGMTTAMLVALGKAEIKTVEDFAGSIPDELVGWVERNEGEVKRHPGALEGFDLSRTDAETMIMASRVKAGWITEEDLLPDAEEDASAEAEGAAV